MQESIEELGQNISKLIAELSEIFTDRDYYLKEQINKLFLQLHITQIIGFMLFIILLGISITLFRKNKELNFKLAKLEQRINNINEK